MTRGFLNWMWRRNTISVSKKEITHEGGELCFFFEPILLCGLHQTQKSVPKRGVFGVPKRQNPFRRVLGTTLSLGETLYFYYPVKGGVTPHSKVIVGVEPPCFFDTLQEGRGSHPIKKIVGDEQPCFYCVKAKVFCYLCSSYFVPPQVIEQSTFLFKLDATYCP